MLQRFINPLGIRLLSVRLHLLLLIVIGLSSDRTGRRMYQHFRARVAPTAYGILCLRLARLVRHLSAAPPRTQDSIRVGG